MSARGRILPAGLAGICAIASLPLAVASADLPFGLGSCLIVPLGAVAVLMTVVSRRPSRRVWWFAFACVCAFCFLLASYLEDVIMAGAVFLQRLTQQGTINLSQHLIEPAALLSVVVLPVTLAILLGSLCGWAVIRLSRRKADEDKATFARWTFSIREVLVGMFAVCMFLGLFVGRITSWHEISDQDRQVFLSRFSDSFTTGNVTLLALPEIKLIDRTLIPESGYRSFMPPGVNEYMVTCRIHKNAVDSWALWSYTCNAEAHDMIYKFAYAEAPTKEQLPAFPFPIKSYVDPTWTMLDGVPK